MPHLNDPKLAAQLLSGISFTINHTSRGDFSLQHVKYDCTLSYGDGENDILHTSYQSVPSIHGEPSLTDVMMSLTSDAMAASDYDIDTFADEFGYTKPSQAIRAYEGCKKSLEWLRDSLGISTEDISVLNQTLDEHADEVKEAIASLAAEAKANLERTHPKVPQGFVTIDSLQENLDLGDYGDQCTEYSDDDIIDRIQSVAYENVDIYTHDLLQWLPDNYEWIEEADAQGLLEGAKGDLIKMTQMAQYECFSQNMYDHQEDIVKYVTLDSLKDAGIYAVSQELADALDTDVDYEGADSFDAALDEAKEQVQNVMAANVTKALGDEDLAQEAAEELVGGDDYATVNPAALSIEAVHLVNEMGYDAAFAKCDFWKEYMDSPQTPDEGSPTLADAAKECRASAAGLSNEAPAHDEVEQEHTSDSRC